MRLVQISWVALLLLFGCVSEQAGRSVSAESSLQQRTQNQALRQKEYEEWKDSEDGSAFVSLEEFESKYKLGWRNRVGEKAKERLSQELSDAKAAEQLSIEERQRKRTELINGVIENDLKLIRESYSKGKRFTCIYPRDNLNHDWLSTWTNARLQLSEGDKLAGDALLDEFGSKYLPNAYANYEKLREQVVELQQVFNEEFPEPWSIKNSSPKWNAFNKVLEKFAKIRTEYFYCHDELCNYWMKKKFNVLSAVDFAKIDSQKLSVQLLPENVAQNSYTFLKINLIESKVADFVMKYAPECFSLFQNFEHEEHEMKAVLAEVERQRLQMDDIRYDRTLDAAVFKLNDLARMLNELSTAFQMWYVDYRAMEKSSDDIAKCDLELARALKPFKDSLPTYVKDRVFGPVIPASDMIEIPGWQFKMQRYEVSQMQWMIVMGENPSCYKGADHPVENVSLEDCREFIKKLNAVDGRCYRLPSGEEWEFACLAGSSENWGRRKNGEDGPLDVMGWYKDNAGKCHHSVGLKAPNQWGLYDMHGNVKELCGRKRSDYYFASGDLGFRLVVSHK